MWKKLAEYLLQYKYILLALLLAITALMGWQASKVKLSYEFAKSIPTNNPKYLLYQQFRQKFGEDGNLMVIGLQTDRLFQPSFFNAYTALQQSIKNIPGVADVIAVPAAVNLVKDEATEKLKAVPVFEAGTLTKSQIDSSAAIFLNLPFYRGLLYNPATQAWLMGVHINGSVLNSPRRTAIVDSISQMAQVFGAGQQVAIHLSGLPLIRTVLAARIQKEMKWFTLFSIALSAIILLLFFRSVSAMLLSLSVVIIGVIWSFGILQLLGYKITLLTALIPPLIVVIGIPNCIYFLNKYHTAYRDTGNKQAAIVQMIAKMGVVTLFCNIAAAIGFAVFAFTKSAVLKEFGAVAGSSIMLLFLISLILIPAAISLMAAPKTRHTQYLDNKKLQLWLDRLEYWSLHHRPVIFITTAIVLAFSIAGIFRLKSVGYIVDDLPKTDKVYTDLKFFENNFKGVMPLEILVDTRKKNGLRRNMLQTFTAMDSLTQYLAAKPYMGRSLSLVQGLKFAKQAFFEGDSTNYSLPTQYDLPALAQYLSMRGDSNSNNAFGRLIATFMDSAKQEARISVTMQDVGSARLPLILDSIQARANALFDKDQYRVLLTGTSVTFLEGSRFIINGLKESILWAFLLIALCMLYLFRSFRILLCSLLPNIIPLAITAGVMGWAGVALKPSTVLVFSVALGIAIDITIRFLVNYKQELHRPAAYPEKTVIQTIHTTGLSIIYTSIVLIAGFIIFCFSSFGGTMALGWLTSLTLVTATMANLILLPALLITLYRNKPTA